MLTAQIGLIDPNDYWSTARSGGEDGLGLIDPNDWWSTARSGGQDGLGEDVATPSAKFWAMTGIIVGSGLGLLAGFFIGRRARRY